MGLGRTLTAIISAGIIGLSGKALSEEYLLKDFVSQQPVSNAMIIFNTTPPETTYTDSLGRFYYPLMPDWQPGDNNGDGEVRGNDVTYLVRYFKGYNPAPEPLIRADVNGDCLVTGSDVTKLVRYFKFGEPIIGCPNP
jgi:hypothetical protein